MAEYAHDTAIGNWFFQATPTAVKLDRMTKNTRAAHWNKPRATRYRASAKITTTQTEDTEDTHQLLLSGVRVIRGPQTGTVADGYDVEETAWVGNPQVLFPSGQGLPPFVRRPIPSAIFIGMEIEKTNPDDGDYAFLNWFGGLDWSQANATSPEGVQYNVNQLFDNDEWVRCSVARPITVSHTGSAGASDLTIGLRFRIIFGRLGGAYNFPTVFVLGGRARGYYIHYHVMGPVTAY